MLSESIVGVHNPLGENSIGSSPDKAGCSYRIALTLVWSEYPARLTACLVSGHEWQRYSEGYSTTVVRYPRQDLPSYGWRCTRRLVRRQSRWRTRACIVCASVAWLPRIWRASAAP